jgi:ABC-type amino acid transport substrate-binding protein
MVQRRFLAIPVSNGMGAIMAMLLIGLTSPAAWPQSQGRVLRVGVVDGAHPCAFREDGVWKGLAVDLWNRVATEENYQVRQVGRICLPNLYLHPLTIYSVRSRTFHYPVTPSNLKQVS